MLIYIHGFNSSPASSKAQLLKARMEALGRGAEFAAPALPHSPAQAAAPLDALATRHPHSMMAFDSKEAACPGSPAHMQFRKKQEEF